MSIQPYAVAAAIEHSFADYPYSGLRGLYAHRNVVNGSAVELNRVLKRLRGVHGAVATEDLHCTTMYSEVAVPLLDAKHGISRAFAMATVIGATSFGRFFVLLLQSDTLERDNRRWKSLGAKYTHPKYNPHVTMLELGNPLSDAANENLVNYVNASGVVGMQITLSPEKIQDNSDC